MSHFSSFRSVHALNVLDVPVSSLLCIGNRLNSFNSRLSSGSTPSVFSAAPHPHTQTETSQSQSVVETAGIIDLVIMYWIYSNILPLIAVSFLHYLFLFYFSFFFISSLFFIFHEDYDVMWYCRRRFIEFFSIRSIVFSSDHLLPDSR